MKRVWLVIGGALLLAMPARANVGRATFPGTRIAEPAGLRDIAIEREQLSFDLRPLADREFTNVSARYVLDNRSAAPVTAPLVFVAGAAMGSESSVTFDRTTVLGERLSQSQVAGLPAAWSAPVTTPAIGGGSSLRYETEGNAAIAFTLAVPPGQHELVVTYKAVAQRNRSKSGGTLVYQLGYVLAPARDWGSFATLDVSVEVPPGWRVATAPALARTGDALRGHFASLPADTIGITVQAPTGTLHAVLQFVLPLLVLVVLVAGGFALYAIGRARGRRTHDLGAVWPVSLPASLLWAVAIATSGGYAAIRSDLALPDGQSAAYGYGGAFGILLAVVGALVAIPIGHVIARAGSRAGGERA
jgi:hypothetical protein